MKLSEQEFKILIDKYKKENLSKTQIQTRIKNILEFDDYIKFAKKYLKWKI